MLVTNVDDFIHKTPRCVTANTHFEILNTSSGNVVSESKQYVRTFLVTRTRRWRH